MVNKAILLGHLGRDPELKTTTGGFSVATLNMATSEKRKDQSGNWVDATEWHSVSVFGKTAENAVKFLKKGSQVYIEGKITSRKYNDKNGVEKWATSILADKMEFVGKKDSGSSSQATGGFEGHADADSSDDSDDPPF